MRIYSDTRAEVTVNEHRAPTDESIKIYEEMKRKALDSLIDIQHIKTNVFEGVVVEWEDYINGSTKYRCKYKLNGKEFTTDVDISKIREFTEKDLRPYAELRDKVAQEIATEIVIDALEKQPRSKFK